MVISSAARASRYAWIILGATIVIGLVVGGLGRFGYTLILPNIRDNLELSYAQSGLLATVNFAGYLTAALLGGVVNARFGVRQTSAGGLVVMGAGLIASAFAPSYLVLLPLQFPVGFGTGTVMIAAISTLPAWFPPRQRGLVSGLGNGAAGLGIALSGLVVPLLLTTFAPSGWRPSFVVFAGAAAIAFLAAAIFLRRRAVSPGAAPTAGPALKPRLRTIYGNIFYWRFASVTLLMGATTAVYGTFFGAYGTQQIGLSAAFVGHIWTGVGILSIFSGILWGIISDRTGRKAALAGVLGVQFVGNLILVLVPSEGALIVSGVIAGLTLFGSAAVMTAVMVDITEPELLPAIGGLLAIGFGVGQLGGPAIAGTLADLTGGLTSIYAFAAVLSAIGVGAILALPATGRRDATPAPQAAAQPNAAVGQSALRPAPATPPAAPEIAPNRAAPALAAERDLAGRLTRWAAEADDPDLAEAYTILAAQARERAFRLRRSGAAGAATDTPAPASDTPALAATPEPVTAADRFRWLLHRPARYPASNDPLATTLARLDAESRTIAIEYLARVEATGRRGAIHRIDAPAVLQDGALVRRIAGLAGDDLPALQIVSLRPGQVFPLGVTGGRSVLVPLAGDIIYRTAGGEGTIVTSGQAVSIDPTSDAEVTPLNGWPAAFLLAGASAAAARPPSGEPESARGLAGSGSGGPNRTA